MHAINVDSMMLSEMDAIEDIKLLETNGYP